MCKPLETGHTFIEVYNVYVNEQNFKVFLFCKSFIKKKGMCILHGALGIFINMVYIVFEVVW